MLLRIERPQPRRRRTRRPVRRVRRARTRTPAHRVEVVLRLAVEHTAELEGDQPVVVDVAVDVEGAALTRQQSRETGPDLTGFARGKHVPRSLLDEDLKSDAERKVFDALRDQLPDEWEVFHSASVISRDPAEGARDDEGDFVLVPPRARHRRASRSRAAASSAGTASGSGSTRRQARADARPVHPGARPPLRRSSARSRTRTAAQDEPLHRPRARVPGHQRPPARARARRAAARSSSTATTSRTSQAAIERVLAYHRGSRDKRERARSRRRRACSATCSRRTFRIEVPMATMLRGGGAASSSSSPTSRRRCSAASAATGAWSSPAAPARARRCSRSSAASELAATGSEVLFVCFNKALREAPAGHASRSTGSTSSPSTRSARTWRIASEVDAPDVRRRRRRRSTGTTSCPTRWSMRSGSLGGAVRRAPRRRGPGPAHRLARRADLHAPRRGRRLDLAVHGRQPARLRRPARRPARVPAVRPDRQLPQHPGDPPRGDEALRGRASSPRRRAPRGATSSCYHDG